MGLISQELSLDLQPTTFIPKPITCFLREIAEIKNVSEKFSKLDEYIKMLEEEKKKIDPFKLQLPLSMLLLKDAILTLKEETTHFTKLSDEIDSKDSKMNWMSSARLWTSNDSPKVHTLELEEDKKKLVESQGDEEDDISASEGLLSLSKCNNEGESFPPLKGFNEFPFPVSVVKRKKEDVEARPLTPPLSLSTPGGMKNSNTELPSQRGSQQSHQPPRKQRRCWLPDLHRRFVNALQQLGGSQVATPKQIRELMKVDGLTNDEVKSHLQKYRLHSRRLPNASSSSSKSSNNSQSESPQGPLQLAVGVGGGDSMEDEKSESYSWKGHHHHLHDKHGESDA